MKVSVHLRSGPNLTNWRSECLANALEPYCTVVRRDRSEGIEDADLMIQTGFARSVALLDAIDKGIPYLIAEAPFWRDFYPVDKAISWGYNGLAGGAWAPPPPEEESPKPELLPMKAHDEPVLIIGQKPTDHSLRGTDHVQWILDRRREIPGADFRPHPLMVKPGTLEPLDTCLRKYGRVVTFTSTVGAEALVYGCHSQPWHRGSIAYGVTDRERWHHELSWRQAYADSISPSMVENILSGLDEARDRAIQGLVERPRDRVDGRSVEQRYYALMGG